MQVPREASSGKAISSVKLEMILIGSLFAFMPYKLVISNSLAINTSTVMS